MVGRQISFQAWQAIWGQSSLSLGVGMPHAFGRVELVGVKEQSQRPPMDAGPTVRDCVCCLKHKMEKYRASSWPVKLNNVWKVL